MPEKTERLTILIDHQTKIKLDALAESSDLTMSQILRRLIKLHLNQLDDSSALPQKADEGKSPTTSTE
ncbi:ribbon-helix-helix protein, CopG family [Pseudomonas sp. P5_152]|uniref:ribbon-helix-helix protein, CopG family n=1 Tax=Pseudomonas sp. P5_152 TaxID=3043442 RepID=UPI002A370916|nr:ribbon-helix-helix protein, CopG family [Pseudomonas sp. P5_152]MDX9667999.1 ribbon-helix-helix protein, CopG family [Pseudomonas sp. P5_152]